MIRAVCGIAGLVSRNARLAPEVLERATRSLAHRGPDDSGTVIFEESSVACVGLGNRRLAILDLSPLAHQPMQDPATGNWIVYNGEIYNFREVRRELEAEGIPFASQSDTEVVLKAYGRWGEECLQRFRGMFGFAIWDHARARLFLARDPLGVKPLYCYRSSEYFLFASEVRALLATGLIARTLDREGLLDYLTFGCVCNPRTLIDGVHSLLPGHYLIWKDGELQDIEYWKLPVGSGSARGSSIQEWNDNGQADIRGLLENSVREQLVSDVPLGVFLSGGIDSSALVALLAKTGTPVNTFSLVFRENEFSEARYSREIADRFATEHREICISQGDTLEAIPGALRAMDQPTIDGINTYLVSSHARAAGLKVALSGIGGDELFAGYSTFQDVPRMENVVATWRHVPKGLRSALNSGYCWLSSTNDRSRKVSALLRDPDRIGHPYFLSRMLFTPEQGGKLLGGKYVNSGSGVAKTTGNGAEEFDPINRVSYFELRWYAGNMLLRDADAMSMAQGLEIRVPFLDQRLVEHLLRVPGPKKLRNGVHKPVLIDALGGSLPASVTHRPKQGFTFPFEHWLRDELRPDVESTLARVGEGRLGNVLDPNVVWGIWQRFLAGKTSWSRPWSLYVLDKWCESHL